jgi:hypothetical protein
MKKRRGRPPAKERVIYSIEIMDYKPSYSVSVDHLKELNPDPISEHSEIEITGRLTYPAKVADKILSLRILGSRNMQHGLQHPHEIAKDVDKVGDLEIRGKKAEFIGFVLLFFELIRPNFSDYSDHFVLA